MSDGVPMEVKAGWRLYDKLLFAVRQREARAGRPIVFTCTKGCSACCKEPAQITKQEAQAIFNAVPEAKRAEVKERVVQWLAVWRSSGLLAKQKTGEMNVFEYRALNLFCPLLENSLCSVYENRPLACRGHHAVGPRQRCDDDAQRKDQVFVDSRQLVIEAVHRMAWTPGMPKGRRPIFMVDYALLGEWLALLFGLISESEVTK